MKKKPKAVMYWAIVDSRDHTNIYCDFAEAGYPMPTFDTRLMCLTYMRKQSPFWHKSWKPKRVTITIDKASK